MASYADSEDLNYSQLWTWPHYISILKSLLKSQKKAALVTSEGLFEPTKIIQGLCNAPETFQSAMELIIMDLKLAYVLVYLDFITVFSATLTNHPKNLKSALLS